MENVIDRHPSIHAKVAAMRRGAEWFFWIAVLAVINSLAVTYGGVRDFIFGLGGTRLVDEALRQNPLAGVDPSGLTANFLIAALFAAFGYFARKGSDFAFILGMFLYVVDAMIVIGFRDFFAFGFHMVALFFLFKGLLASRRRFDPSV